MIDIVVDLHDSLVVVETMQHEARVVKSLAYVASRRPDYRDSSSATDARAAAVSRRCFFPMLPASLMSSILI